MYKKLEYTMNDDDAKNQMGLNIGITVANRGVGVCKARKIKKKQNQNQKVKSMRLANDKTLDRQPEESKTEVRKWTAVLFKN